MTLTKTLTVPRTETPTQTPTEPPTQITIVANPPVLATWSSSDARVSFRQPVSSDGFVDAAWWPRSRDLQAELPALLDVLWTAGRDVNRVSYNLAAWAPAPRRLPVAGRLVRLGGFRRQDPLMISLVDAWRRERVDILVIDPATDPDVALRALAIAGRAGSTESAERIMEIAAQPDPGVGRVSG
jgi:hypothetical protein